MKKFFILFTLIFLGLLFSNKQVFANDYLQIQDNATSSGFIMASGTGHFLISESLPDISGQVQWVTFRFTTHTFFASSPVYAFITCNTSNYITGVCPEQNPYTYSDNTFYGGGVDFPDDIIQTKTFYFTDYIFVAGQYYTVGLKVGANNYNVIFYGSNNDDSFSYGICADTQGSFWGDRTCDYDVGNVKDLYFNLRYAGSDEISFTSPVNYIGSPPQTPYFTGNYSIATSSSWNAIRIKLSQWLFATSTTPLVTHYFDTYLDYGNYQSGTSSVPFLSVFGELESGYYNYDWEFLKKNHSTGEIIEEGGYSLAPHWFWVGLSEGNPYAYPLATASTTPMELCAGIDNSNLVGAFQWALCNVAQWLFVPTGISVDNFQNLGSTFQQKAPFAYFYTISNSFSSLSSTATPAFSLSTSTGAFNTSIFQPLKIGLTWLLWLMFGIFCIKRIAKFDF